MTRILYLRHLHGSISGQTATAENILVSAFREKFIQAIVMHMIVGDGEGLLAPVIMEDAITEAEVSQAGITTIYCEGGIRSQFGDSDQWFWKVPADFAEKFVRAGNVLIIADIDYNFARVADERFQKLVGFGFRYGSRNSQHKSPVYFVDMKDDLRLIDTDVSGKDGRISEWLHPCFDHITQLRVHAPVELEGEQDPLVFVNSPTGGTLCDDAWWAPPSTGLDLHRIRYHPDGPMAPGLSGPFAAVRRLGLGFVVGITGWFSSDHITRACPDNVTWMVNLIGHLERCAAGNMDDAAFQRFRGVTVFLSHRSTDKPFVEAVGDALKLRGPRIWFDKERLIPSDSLGLGIDGGFAECSHFVLFWSRHCVGAPWVRFELGSAIQSCVEQGKPIFVIKLDETPVPPSIAQFLRIGTTTDAKHIAGQIADAIAALRVRGQ